MKSRREPSDFRAGGGRLPETAAEREHASHYFDQNCEICRAEASKADAEPTRPAVWDQDRACERCGKMVEEARRCYAHPTCYACLPPPEPLPVRPPTPRRPTAVTTPTRPLTDLQRRAHEHLCRTRARWTASPFRLPDGGLVTTSTMHALRGHGLVEEDPHHDKHWRAAKSSTA